jgi:hypothetical protein
VPRALTHAALGLLALALTSLGCARKTAPPSPRGAIAPAACLDVTAGENSPQTRKVFAARRCQGGGVTWAGILDVLAAHQGHVEPVTEPTPGWSGAVYTLDRHARFSIDDESDAARFCADDPQLLATVRRELARLNTDPGALAQTMGEAKALALECLEADGAAPELPPTNPLPALPPAVVADVHAAAERLKQALQRQPVWCFPTDDYAGRTGALRFWPDGRVTWTAASGEIVGQGRWRPPSENLADPRMEVVVDRVPGARGPGGGMLEHFDLGSSGRIGFDLIGDHQISRREMVPGDGCLHLPPKR